MMIRCSEKHRQECLDYLRQSPSLNLFLIGDIENYGFNQGFQTVFIDKDEFVHGIYLVYYHNLVIASEENRVDSQFVERLVQEYEILVLRIGRADSGTGIGSADPPGPAAGCPADKRAAGRGVPDGQRSGDDCTPD